MPNKNGRLIAAVASVAVAAVAVGAALAYRQGPQNAAADAAPLSSSPSATSPATQATSPALATPSSIAAPSAGPAKITLAISKLAQGREPQVPYLIGRQIRGGSGSDVVVPGKGSVITLGRLDGNTLVVVHDPEATSDTTELLRLDPAGAVRRTPGVSSLVTSSDQRAAAYAAAQLSSLGEAKKGGTVYSETGAGVQTLKLPNVWNLQVLAYTGGKVYYRAADQDTGPWRLFSWVPGSETIRMVSSVVSPTAVSADGSTAASMGVINDDGTCSNVVRLPAGTQLFRTCEYAIDGFTPSGVTAYGGPAHRDGFCDGLVAAFDAGSGKVLHEWKGCFQEIGAEDDQHVLAVAYATPAGQTEKVKTAIIRCTITTGACELATPIGVDTPLVIGS
ncbi:hypothetical protein ACI2LF_07660 [Kribbella sp. NPDC020789]